MSNYDVFCVKFETCKALKNKSEPSRIQHQNTLIRVESYFNHK